MSLLSRLRGTNHGIGGRLDAEGIVSVSVSVSVAGGAVTPVTPAWGPSGREQRAPRTLLPGKPCLMCGRRNATLTLRGEPTRDRDQHAGSHPQLQGTPRSPLCRREKSETFLQEEDSRALKTQGSAPREPLGMLTAQDLKGSSVRMS